MRRPDAELAERVVRRSARSGRRAATRSERSGVSSDGVRFTKTKPPHVSTATGYRLSCSRRSPSLSVRNGALRSSSVQTVGPRVVRTADRSLEVAARAVPSPTGRIVHHQTRPAVTADVVERPELTRPRADDQHALAGDLDVQVVPRRRDRRLASDHEPLVVEDVLRLRGRSAPSDRYAARGSVRIISSSPRGLSRSPSRLYPDRGSVTSTDRTLRCVPQHRPWKDQP